MENSNEKVYSNLNDGFIDELTWFIGVNTEQEEVVAYDNYYFEVVVGKFSTIGDPGYLFSVMVRCMGKDVKCELNGSKPGIFVDDLTEDNIDDVVRLICDLCERVVKELKSMFSDAMDYLIVDGKHSDDDFKHVWSDLQRNVFKRENSTWNMTKAKTTLKRIYRYGLVSDFEFTKF